MLRELLNPDTGEPVCRVTDSQISRKIRRLDWGESSAMA
jgi:hypothetical protein